MRWLLLLLLSCLPSNNTAETANSFKAPYLVVDAYKAFAIGKPQRAYKWQMAPTIRVCLDTEVTKDRVKKAMRFWEPLGYKFDSIYMDYKIGCSEPLYGEIIITLPEGDIGSTNLAATRLYTDKISSDIIKAKIFIYPRSVKKQRVLEHEIGHALGWEHYRQKFHMMHPTWNMGGYDTRGLRKTP